VGRWRCATTLPGSTGITTSLPTAPPRCPSAPFGESPHHRGAGGQTQAAWTRWPRRASRSRSRSRGAGTT
jgi:hypothetical protein